MVDAHHAHAMRMNHATCRWRTTSYVDGRMEVVMCTADDGRRMDACRSSQQCRLGGRLRCHSLAGWLGRCIEGIALDFIFNSYSQDCPTQHSPLAASANTIRHKQKSILTCTVLPDPEGEAVARTAIMVAFEMVTSMVENWVCCCFVWMIFQAMKG